MAIQSQLVTVCSEFGKDIQGLSHEGSPVPGGRLLLTLAGLESNFGIQREFVRFEKGYAPGGKYFKDSPDLRALYRRWGGLACGSFGTFQIMFATAHELGFTGHPIELQQDMTSGFWVNKLINRRFIQRLQAKTLRDILDAYNSGAHVDRYIPTAYIAKGFDIYKSLQGV